MLKHLLRKIEYKLKVIDSLLKLKIRKNDFDAQIFLLSKKSRYQPGKFVTHRDEIIEFPDSKSFIFMYRELFEREIYKFYNHETSPLIIDCGANIGLSVFYFKSEFPNAQIIAFEPDPKLCGYLKKNIGNLDLDGVHVRNTALWSSDGELEFVHEGGDSNRLSLFDTTERKTELTPVKTEKLSPYINKRVHLLKIDIEGAELEVLEEIEHKLHFVDKIFLEYHSFKNQKKKLHRILTLLDENGFDYYIDTPFQFNRSPFVEEKDFIGMDLLLNIFATRK